MKVLNSIEDAARMSMGNVEPQDPLPPGPNYGPFGYFRLGILLLAAIVGVLLVINLF